MIPVFPVESEKGRAAINRTGRPKPLAGGGGGVFLGWLEVGMVGEALGVLQKVKKKREELSTKPDGETKKIELKCIEMNDERQLYHGI